MLDILAMREYIGKMKSTRLNLRCSPQEKSAWMLAAFQANVSLSDYIRERLLPPAHPRKIKRRKAR